MGHLLWNEVVHGVTALLEAANIDDDDNVTVTFHGNGCTETYVLAICTVTYVLATIPFSWSY